MTGLHFDDIKKLLKSINELIDNGNSVIIIEHNLEIIKSSDHVIDLKMVQIILILIKALKSIIEKT